MGDIRLFIAASIAWCVLHLGAPVLARADAAKTPEPDKNCVVIVTSIRKSGESSKEVFRYHATSEDECRSDAHDHEANFAPQVIKKKIVKYRWVKPE